MIALDTESPSQKTTSKSEENRKKASRARLFLVVYHKNEGKIFVKKDEIDASRAKNLDIACKTDGKML